METKANYVLVGVFTLAVIAAACAFVYWFSRTGASRDHAVYRAVFDGSVSGLRRGSSVLFNGIKYGEVTNLKLDVDDPHKVVATLTVERQTPVRADTKVTLEYQGLTGAASVALKGGAQTAPVLEGVNNELPTLYAEPGAGQDLAQSARDTMGHIDSVVQRIDTFLAESDTSLRATVHNIENFTASLAQKSDRFDNVLAGLDKLTGPETQSTIAEIKNMARSFRVLAEDVDKRTVRELDALLVEGRRTLGDISRAVKNFDANPSRIIFGGGGSSATTTPESTPASPTPARPARPAPAATSR
jgi:phospholipid/cholesterol/gamma-HCH transport system substrate-binding protein